MSSVASVSDEDFPMYDLQTHSVNSFCPQQTQDVYSSPLFPLPEGGTEWATGKNELLAVKQG